MKRRNFRYEEVAAAADSTQISNDKLLSIFMHENQHLRSLVEGKGRITVDRDLKAECDRQKERIANLQRQLQRANADRHHRSQQAAQFESKVEDVRQLVNEQNGSVRKSIVELQEELALAEHTRQERDAQEKDTTSKLTAELDRRDQEIEDLRAQVGDLHRELAESSVAQADLGHLLVRLSRSPITRLLRRRRDFRDFETRWPSR